MCGGNSRAKSAQRRSVALSWRRSGSGGHLAVWGSLCLGGEGPVGIAKGRGCADHCTVHRAAPTADCPIQTVGPRLQSPNLGDRFRISSINLMLSQQLSYIKKGLQVKKHK